MFIGDPSTPVTGEWLTLQPILDSMLGTTTTNDILDLFQIHSVQSVVTPDDLYPTTIYSLTPIRLPTSPRQSSPTV